MLVRRTELSSMHCLGRLFTVKGGGSRNVWKDRCRDVSAGLLHGQEIYGGAHNSLLDEKERCEEAGEKKDGIQILAGFPEKIHV